MKKKIIIAIVCMAAGIASADLLYGISSFNNAGTIASDANWYAGITTINVGTGLTGTTDAELKTLAIAGGLTTDTYGGTRFRNVESHNAAYETVTIDPGTGGYFQFGVNDGGLGTMTATNLSFQSRAATGSDGVGRGYSIEVSIDGGAYSALASGTVVNGRDNGLMDSISIPLTGYANISSIDFRVSSTVGGVEFTDIAVAGAIPEPATLGLVAMFGGGIMVVRRKLMM